jgi:hypothetical protein
MTPRRWASGPPSAVWESLAALFSSGDDPLERWNHPNHFAGFLADVALLLYERGVEEADNPNQRKPSAKALKRYRRAASSTVRAAKAVWTVRGRLDFAARWARLTGNADALAYRHGGEPAYLELVTKAAQILCDQDRTEQGIGRRAKYLGSARAWVTLTEDDVSDLEIRWRIRDWLSLTDDVTNIPPRPRLAAAAAWRVGARTVAFQIVVDAAAQMVGMDGA